MKKVDTSQDKPTSNITLTKQHSRDNHDNIDKYYTKTKILEDISITTRSSYNSLRHDKMSTAATNNYTIGCERNVSKEQASRDILQELVESSSVATRLVNDLPIEEDRYVLRQQVYLSSNDRNTSHILLDKDEK